MLWMRGTLGRASNLRDRDIWDIGGTPEFRGGRDTPPAPRFRPGRTKIYFVTDLYHLGCY